MNTEFERLADALAGFGDAARKATRAGLTIQVKSVRVDRAPSQWVESVMPVQLTDWQRYLLDGVHRPTEGE